MSKRACNSTVYPGILSGRITEEKYEEDYAVLEGLWGNLPASELDALEDLWAQLESLRGEGQCGCCRMSFGAQDRRGGCRCDDGSCPNQVDEYDD